MAVSGGLVLIDVLDGEELLFSQNYACPDHGISIEELSPRMFSFNNPAGACEKCTGLGTFMKVDPALVIPDQNRSIRGGAIRASGWYFAEGGLVQSYFEALADHYHFSLDIPFKQLPKEIQDIILYGNHGEKITVQRESGTRGSTFTTDFEGIIHNLERRFRTTNSSWIRNDIASLMSSEQCPDCHGHRLKPEYLAVTVGDKNISDFCRMSVVQALDFLDTLQLTERQKMISAQILKEIRARLGFLQSVGLEYLTLARSASTLSGGESQRIRLATQIGSSLMGVLYILDEPSIGLHQKDNHKLIATLKRLRDIGNTLIVVEHDEDTMRAADFIVDIGPGAGVHGGEVVCAGTLEDIISCEKSITGQYLSGKKKVEVPAVRRKGNGKYIEIVGATENNLKNISVKIPLGTFTGVTGVSGSGKSSLINEILYKRLAGDLNGARIRPGNTRIFWVSIS